MGPLSNQKFILGHVVVTLALLLHASHAAIIVATSDTMQSAGVVKVKKVEPIPTMRGSSQSAGGAALIGDDQIAVTTSAAAVLGSGTSLLELHALRRSNVTLDSFFCAKNLDCVACTNDGCDYCLWSGECVTKLAVTEQCQFNKTVSLPPGAGAWLKTPQMCNLTWEPLTGDWSGAGMNISGCPDPNAQNYMFMATVDSGECTYGPHAFPSSFPPAYCICSTGGYSTPYGRFCGSGYTGHDGQQPCDRGDKCAQMHDWCVGQLGYSSCNCTVGLVNCMRAVKASGDQGFCGTLQAAITTVLEEIYPAYQICPSSTHPLCDDGVNCSGHGTCGPDGQCDCVEGWSGYMCDVPQTSN